MIKYTPGKDPALYDEMVFIKVRMSGEMNLETTQDDLDWFRARGAVREAPDLTNVVDSRFVDYAVQRLGPDR